MLAYLALDSSVRLARHARRAAVCVCAMACARVRVCVHAHMSTHGPTPTLSVHLLLYLHHSSVIGQQAGALSGLRQLTPGDEQKQFLSKKVSHPKYER